MRQISRNDARGGLALVTGAFWFGRHSVKPVVNPSFHKITFRTGTILQARFAPDGQTIAYSAAWDGRPQEVFSTRFDSSDSRSVGLPPAQLLAISSKGELPVSLRPTGFAFGSSGTLARVPLAGGAPRELLDKVLAADWTPDGQSLVVVRENTANTYSHLEFPPGKEIYTPKGWASHVRFSPDGTLLAFLDHIPGR